MIISGIIGFAAGWFIGAGLMAALSVGKRADEKAEKYWSERHE